MSTDEEGPQARRRQTEEAAILRLVERLERRFPDVPSTEIEGAVRAKYAEFAGSRIRAFVPTLVERALRPQLAQHPGTTPD